MTDGYTVRRVEHLVPELTHDAFLAGREGWFAAVDAGHHPLPEARCHIVSSTEAGFPLLRPIPPEEVPVQRPLGMPFQGPGLRPSLSYPTMSISRLRATCIPGGIVLRDDSVLANSFSAPWDTNQHRHMTAIDGAWHIDADRGFAPGHVPTIDQPVLYLDDQHIDWFGHVLADLLSPGWAYEYCRSFQGMDRLAVLCSRPKFAFVQHLVRLLGVADHSILLIDRPVTCRNLIVATRSFQIQEYVAPPAIRMWRSMRSRVPAPCDRIDRLYVSRRANPTRRLVEEDRIEAIFERLGFRIFHPEFHTIHQQIAIFSGAKLIAGCSGSNLFNLAFQASARAILVLASPLLVHYSEQMASAHHTSVSFDLVIGSVTEEDKQAAPGWVHIPWHLEPSLLQDFATRWVRDNA